MEQQLVTTRDYDFAAMQTVVFALRTAFPFLRLTTVGQSVLGREIYCLSLGNEDRPAVLYAGAFHGTEHITSALLLRFAERVCRSAERRAPLSQMNIRLILKEHHLLIIPRVNPDGCEIALHGGQGAPELADRLSRLCGKDFGRWNANAQGVDINHNFNAGWERLQAMERAAGIFGPGPRQYGGPSPESEPETIALTRLCRERCVSHVLAFHSQGEEIYWRYGSRTPRRSKKMAEIFAASSGYTQEAPIGLASHGGFKDWFIQEMGRPGFTFEVGKGQNPLPCEQLDSIYDRLEESMLLAAVM